MTNDWAKKTADKYIRRDGRAPADAPDADAAWRAEAETVHRFLRSLKSKRAREALAAFERIGEAIGAARRHRTGRLV